MELYCSVCDVIWHQQLRGWQTNAPRDSLSYICRGCQTLWILAPTKIPDTVFENISDEHPADCLCDNCVAFNKQNQLCYKDGRPIP
jgi:hypothetical protein